MTADHERGKKLSRTVDFLENLIRYQGLRRILGALGAFVGGLVAIGVINDRESATPFVFLGVATVCLLLLLAMGLDRRRVYRILKQDRTVLNHYARNVNALQDSTYFEILHWEEDVSVNARGRTDIVRRFKIRVGPAAMSTFWTSINIDPAPETAKYQQKVKITALLVDTAQPTTEAIEDGIAVLYSPDWRDHTLHVYIHLPEHMPAREEFDVALVITWPGYFDHLIAHDEDGVPNLVPCEWVFHRSMETFTYSLRLDRKFTGGRKVQVRHLRASPAAAQSEDVHRNTLVTFAASKPPIGKSIGFNLQMRAVPRN